MTAGFGRLRAAPARFGAGMALAAALVTGAALLPLGFVVAVAAGTGWARIVALVVRPRVGELLVDTSNGPKPNITELAELIARELGINVTQVLLIYHI